MQRLMKMLGIVAVSVTVLTGQAVLANCQDPGSVYPLNQCGQGSWFEPPPAGSGPVSAAYWQLGKGNLGLLMPTTVLGNARGNCFQGTAATGYWGCDSGSLGSSADPTSAGLQGAEGVGGPAGSLCFGATASWTRTGNDGCADNVPGTALAFDDNVLNAITPLYDSTIGAYRYDAYYVDAPIGVLLREDTGKHFAMAFLSTAPRQAGDRLPGGYVFGELGKGADRRGDPNPSKPAGAFDVVPWQPVPRVKVLQVLSLTPTDAMIQIGWDAVRIIDDGSAQPGPNAGRCGGVGVRDCAPTDAGLYRRTIQRGTHDGTACGNFVNDTTPGLNPVPAGAGQTTLTVPRGTCFRMLTDLGLSIVQATPSLLGCRTGQCGDRGVAPYPGAAPPASSDTFIAPPGVSNRITLVSATTSGSSVSVNFNTTAELDITRFDVIGVDGRGRESLITSVDPQEGSSGVGADYSISLSKSQLKGSKSLVIVSQPSGERSNVLAIN